MLSDSTILPLQPGGITFVEAEQLNQVVLMAVEAEPTLNYLDETREYR